MAKAQADSRFGEVKSSKIKFHNGEPVQAGPITAGRLSKAENIARRRLDVIRQAERTLRGEGSYFGDTEKARRMLEAEMKASEGGEL